MRTELSRSPTQKVTQKTFPLECVGSRGQHARRLRAGISAPPFFFATITKCLRPVLRKEGGLFCFTVLEVLDSRPVGSTG